LKPRSAGDDGERDPVAPRAGAWIETELWRDQAHASWVAPRAGAWIETRRDLGADVYTPRRPPRGGVD